MSLRRNLQDNKILSSTLLCSTKNKCGLPSSWLFAIQDENTEAIKEALHVLRKWNASRNPKMFMVDNCDEEIDAIEWLTTAMKRLKQLNGWQLR